MAGSGKRSPAASKLGHSKVAEILSLLAEGHGRMRACLMSKVAYRTFQKRMAEDLDLRDQVLQAERARVDDFVKTIYDLRNHSEALVRLSAAKAYLHRDERQREARRAVRDRRQGLPQTVNDRPSSYLPTLLKVLKRYVPEDRLLELADELERVASQLDCNEVGPSQGKLTTNGS
jgi:hypothetical protein